MQILVTDRESFRATDLGMLLASTLQLFADHLIHAWDLARAVGADERAVVLDAHGHVAFGDRPILAAATARRAVEISSAVVADTTSVDYVVQDLWGLAS